MTDEETLPFTITLRGLASVGAGTILTTRVPMVNGEPLVSVGTFCTLERAFEGPWRLATFDMEKRTATYMPDVVQGWRPDQ